MTKTFCLLLLATPLCLMISCSNTKPDYIDLRTGERIELEKDPATGAWIDARTKKPVYIYVDAGKNDTIYGKTGKVINGHIVKSSDNIYWYDADLEQESKLNGDNYKKKVEEDGDVKIKDGDQKVKIDGETGEKKVKND